MENLVALCGSTCHNIATESVHQNPRLARERGFIVPRHADPAEVPLILPNGQERMLLCDGTANEEGETSPWHT